MRSKRDIVPTELLLDALYVSAPRCRVCGAPDTPGLCALCRASCLIPEDRRCQRCGRPTGANRLCPVCSGNDFVPYCGVAAYSYTRTASLIHDYKFAHMHTLAPFIARDMARVVKQNARIKADVVTSVPIHPLRMLIRGYDQAALLGRAVARELALPYEPYLRRVIYKRSMSLENPNFAARHEYIRDAYALARPVPPNMRVLIVDDVLTSGATLSTCAAKLISGGAARVYSCVAAAVDMHPTAES